MQSINLSLIKPSPNPVRKTWNEGKMDELAQSIREQGVIVPIKVRPNGEGYEIVYGHRRAEAAKRAGLAEIPAIVEGVDDTDALIQALIENLQREDMNAEDKGRAMEELQALTGWSGREIDRQGIASEGLVRRWLHYKSEMDNGLRTIVRTQDDSHVMQVDEARRALGDDIEAKRAVVGKAISEELNYKDTRAVADAYVKADTPELKQSVLDTPVKSGDVKLQSPEAILRQARKKLGIEGVREFDREVKEEKKKAKLEIQDSAVKEFIEQTRAYNLSVHGAIENVDYGRFSPEAAQFAIRRLVGLQDAISELIIALEEVK